MSLIERLKQVEASPDRLAAETLLRCWTLLRLDLPLPLFIFSPNILVNLSPSRSALQSKLTLLDASQLDAAVSTLVNAKVVRKYESGDISFLIFQEMIGFADLEYISTTYGTSDDSFIAQVAELLFCIYPQFQIGLFVDNLVEALFLHANALSSRLLRRRAAGEMKQLLNSDHFLQFLIAQQRNSLAQRPTSMWNLHLMQAEMNAMGRELKQLIEGLSPPLKERSARLQFEWQYLQAYHANNYEQCLALVDAYLKNHSDKMYGYEFVFAYGVQVALLAPQNAEKAQAALQKLIACECAPALRSECPDAHTTAIKAAVSVLARRLSFKIKYSDLKALDQLCDAASRETACILPYLKGMHANIQMFDMAEEKDRSDVHFPKRVHDLALRVCEYMGAASNMGRMTLDYVMTVLVESVPPAPSAEAFLKSLVDMAAKQNGAHSPEFMSFLLDCAKSLRVHSPESSNFPYEWSRMAVRLAMGVFPQESATYVDIMLRASEEMIFSRTDVDHAILLQTIKTALQGGILTLHSVSMIFYYIVLTSFASESHVEETMKLIEDIKEAIQSRADAGRHTCHALKVAVELIDIQLQFLSGEEDKAILHLAQILARLDTQLRSESADVNFAVRYFIALFPEAICPKLDDDDSNHALIRDALLWCAHHATLSATMPLSSSDSYIIISQRFLILDALSNSLLRLLEMGEADLVAKLALQVGDGLSTPDEKALCEGMLYKVTSVLDDPATIRATKKFTLPASTAKIPFSTTPITQPISPVDEKAGSNATASPASTTTKTTNLASESGIIAKNKSNGSSASSAGSKFFKVVGLLLGASIVGVGATVLAYKYVLHRDLSELKESVKSSLDKYGVKMNI